MGPAADALLDTERSDARTCRQVLGKFLRVISDDKQ